MIDPRARLALGLPLPRSIGCELVDDADPARNVWFEATEAVGNGTGGVHAGALGIAAELAAYLTALPTLADDQHAVTHTSTTQLLRAAPLGSRLVATPTASRRTRHLAFVRVVLTAGDQEVAHVELVKSVLDARR